MASLPGRKSRVASACLWASLSRHSICGWQAPTAASMLIGSALIIPGLAIRALASGHVQKNEQLTTYRTLRLYAQSALSWFADSGRGLCDHRPKLVDRRRTGFDLSGDLLAGDSRGRSIPGRTFSGICGLRATSASVVASAKFRSTTAEEHFPGTCTGSIASTMRHWVRWR